MGIGVGRCARLARLLLLAALLGPALCVAAAPDDAGFARLTATFQATVAAERAATGVPGIVAAVALADGRMCKVAAGLADVERRVAATPDTRMLSGSTGKTLAAAVAVKLAAQGAWSLDDKLSKYLGSYPWFSRLPNAELLTIRLLLQHRGGIDNYYDNPRFFVFLRQKLAENPGYVANFDTLIEFVLDQPPLFAPGQGFKYTDVGYLLVGLALEQATGRKYYDLAREFFLDPFALLLTTPSNRRTLPGLAQGYANGQNPLLLGPHMLTEGGALSYDPSIEFTAGGFATNAGDLARWAQALYSGAALGAAGLATMLAPAGDAAADASHPYYGLGVGVYPAGGGLPRAYGHDGYIPGYRSSVRYYPDVGVAVAFQINTEDGVWEQEAKGGGPAAGHLDFAALRTRLNRAVLDALAQPR
jgi:D-alanyl-D-alanine carboxypeptidase